MSLQNRIATCDICGELQKEISFGAGWPKWGIVQGVGVREPMKGESVANLHREFYLCPAHKGKVAEYLTQLVEWEKSIGGKST